jgi:hypothetical protein
MTNARWTGSGIAGYTEPMGRVAAVQGPPVPVEPGAYLHPVGP